MSHKTFIGLIPFIALSGCVADETELSLEGEEAAEEAQELAADPPAAAEAPGPIDLKAEQGASETALPPAVLLVAPVEKWKYLVQPGPYPKTYGDCRVPDGDWTGEYFDPYGWEEGRAELGYGDGDEQTVINAGPSADKKCITQFFRHEFEVKDPDAFKSLILRLLRDDGAVVYLNGYEIVRSNMPLGYIDAYTPAKTTVVGSDEDRFFEYSNIPAGLLKYGTNVLAVEVHQVSRKDYDLSFNAELLGVLDPYDPYRETLSFASKEATIDESRPNTRLGGDGACKADGASGEDNSDPDKEQVCLSQWDLKSLDLYWQPIPPNSRVVAAHLVVKVINTSPDRYPVVPVRTPWLENKVTWNDPNGDLYGDWEDGRFSKEDLEDYPVTVVNALYTGTHIITLPPWLVQEWIDDPYENAGLAIVDFKHANGIDFAAGGDGLKLEITIEPDVYVPG